MERKNLAFTMAEILLSLTIIGVVAAITLPSLTGNINERTWNTQRKALHSRISQAIALMPKINGYGTYVSNGTDNAAETFVTAGLAKVLKINNICNYDKITDCGFAGTDKYKNLDGKKLSETKMGANWYQDLRGLNSMFTDSASLGTRGDILNPQANINPKTVAFETANGESMLTYYNPRCLPENASLNILNNTNYNYTGEAAKTQRQYSQPFMCANFIYDLNGSRGPNTAGKDVGWISVIYATDSVVVAPVPINYNFGGATSNQEQNVNNIKALELCKSLSENSRLPNIEEAMSMAWNSYMLSNNIYSSNRWSSSRLMQQNDSTKRAWAVSLGNGLRLAEPITSNAAVRCVKR